jgi:predicted DNA-binding transcriptional regulator YafY
LHRQKISHSEIQLRESHTFHRLWHIVNALNLRRNVNARTLSRELEVSERTIKRDIQYMRDVLEMDIEWESAAKTYFCEREYEYIPLLRVTADEALALALASRTFSAWSGTALGGALMSVFQKLGDVAGGSVTVPAKEVQQFLSSPDFPEEPSFEHQNFARLLEAIRRKREISISYQKPNSKLQTSRVLHPLHLAYLDHSWALVAWDDKKNEPRKFLLYRIEKLVTTGERFEFPQDFDLTTYLKNSFGLFSGDQVFEMVIQFDAYAAAYIREKKWHDSQAVESLPNGDIRACFRVNHLMDIQRWVLSWGSYAQVLTPDTLRNNVYKELKALIGKYS